MTELMVAVALLSIGTLGFFGAFRFIARTVFISRAQSLATNLAQERVEYLKNLNYYALQITTVTATDGSFTPAIIYDTSYYPPETIVIGGVTFLRYTYVTMAEVVSGNISAVGADYPDTGLKQISVNILWTDNGQKKKWGLTNLLENPAVNPLDATITGTVNNSAGGTVASALVEVEGNSSWSANTSATGSYSFQVYHGTYTIRASSQGFTDATSGPQVVARAATKTVTPALTLTQIATGSIQGIVWYNPDLVISQVVASTLTVVGNGTTKNVEYIELYNPTTYPINIGTTGSYPKSVALRYRDENAAFDKDDSAAGFDFVHVTTYVAPGHYYLYANATAFYILGAQVIADAYSNSVVSYPNNIRDDKAGSIQIYRPSTGLNIDTVGWDDNPAGGCLYYEGSVIPDQGGANDGLGTPAGKQIVRVSSPGISAATLASFGRAYDSDNNARDWLYESAGFSGFVYAPKTMASGAFTTLTGKVSTGAFISSSDPNSGATQAFTANITSGALSLPYSRFVLGGISTGTWTVSAAFGGFSASYDNVVVAQNAYTRVPNASTIPAWPGVNLDHTMLSTSSVGGFVKGVITDSNNALLNGITVQIGGTPKVTGANGQYFTSISSGAVTIVVNPNNGVGAYMQVIQTVTITQGAITTQDFTLPLGGRITGYVTTGTTPLSNQPITATSGSGGQAGAATTDASGNFSIRNLSTGTYTIFPVLETGQDANPNTFVPILSSTGTLFIGTFTVTGALGSIDGTITDASGLVTTGALLVASTSTISSTLPLIAGSSAQALIPIYMASSKADGTFSVPVRGGATYYLSAFVPVINGASVTVTTKTYSGIIVSPSAATTRTVTIP